MRVELRDAVEADIAAILADMRADDVREVTALGSTPEEALRVGLETSDWTATALVDGVPACMFGVAPQSAMTGIGRPWLLGTNAVVGAQVPLLRTCRPVVRAMLDTYPRLLNLVDARNTVSLRWLRWLGFRFDDEALPCNGQQFYVFRLGDW